MTPHHDLGRYVEIDGRPAVRLVRRLPHPPERVWAAVTDPSEMRHWFPSAVTIDPRPGGEMTFADDPNTPPSSGTVLEYDPPRRCAFTWGDDEVHIDVEPTDGGSVLTLTNVLDARDAASRNAAGWVVCLDELAGSLDGTGSGGPHSDGAEPWRPLYDAHVEAGLPYGAAIPG
ncbi:SRPBCC family protein [Pseudonocardia endophytica]|uniref:Uncharacterized protein YndB with AHSA1/START domain n=1 Tax=Pseudonocardia endophytica TaxID=401976 RepID=A0A4V2PIE4_PSEEN|nr:SRPBCC family protein [Pseudonocardia endophytica]TCK24316.1 uncharacterized protein YndB with AHSA1/START domain [Pseudonocardia endophytica]